jgi:hypothetical protein
MAARKLPQAVRRSDARRIANGGPAYHGRDLVLVRGKCRVKRCGARYGVRRVTLDFTASRERVERYAGVECVACGTPWTYTTAAGIVRVKRIAEPRLTHPDGALAVRLTLIVPSGEDAVIYRRHGALKREGDEQLVVVDADIAALMTARDAWSVRNGQLLAARKRAAERKAERDAEAVRKSREALARMDARNAEREREEREAAAREAANG